jgi:hypothetical protein
MSEFQLMKTFKYKLLYVIYVVLEMHLLVRRSAIFHTDLAE